MPRNSRVFAGIRYMAEQKGAEMTNPQEEDLLIKAVDGHLRMGGELGLTPLEQRRVLATYRRMESHIFCEAVAEFILCARILGGKAYRLALAPANISLLAGAPLRSGALITLLTKCARLAALTDSLTVLQEEDQNE